MQTAAAGSTPKGAEDQRQEQREKTDDGEDHVLRAAGCIWKLRRGCSRAVNEERGVGSIGAVKRGTFMASPFPPRCG